MLPIEMKETEKLFEFEKKLNYGFRKINKTVILMI